jgi:hypothetical protein
LGDRTGKSIGGISIEGAAAAEEAAQAGCVLAVESEKASEGVEVGVGFG